MSQNVTHEGASEIRTNGNNPGSTPSRRRGNAETRNHASETNGTTASSQGDDDSDLWLDFSRLFLVQESDPKSRRSMSKPKMTQKMLKEGVDSRLGTYDFKVAKATKLKSQCIDEVSKFIVLKETATGKIDERCPKAKDSFEYLKKCLQEKTANLKLEGALSPQAAQQKTNGKDSQAL